jgi:penicillin-binding protein 2
MRRLDPFQGWRLTLFQGVIFAVFVIFTIRLVQWQFIQANQFIIAADDNRLDELPLSAARGTIVDRNGQALAINNPAYNVRITPAALPADETAVLRIYNEISALTGVPPTDSIAALSPDPERSIESFVIEGQGIAPYRPVVVAQDVGQRAALQILEDQLNLPGVDIQVASVREYPSGALTAHIIGYMGRIPAEDELELRALGYDPAFDRIGYAGIESSLEEVLAGERGRIVREVDVAGLPLREVERVEPVAGLNLRLTIDLDLQRIAEEEVRRQIDELNSREEEVITQRASLVAIDPRNGQVLAMVSYPGYDNARFARTIDVEYYLGLESDPLNPLLNQATQSLYPPGSVWKLVTSVGVLGENVIDPASFLVDEGALLLENRYAPNDLAQRQRFVCWLGDGHGNVDMLRGIAQSCNVYFYQVGGGNGDVSPFVLREGGLGPTDLWRYAISLGIGSPLGIELPFPNRGGIFDPDYKRRVIGQQWSTGDTYNAAVGQGFISTTPLHMAAAVSAIANGGTLYQPTLILEESDSNGNVIAPFRPNILRNANLDLVPEGELITLLPIEDMIMRGPSSLVCSCEPDSEYYNPVRCNPLDYRSEVDVNPDPDLETLRPYRVSLPSGYTFGDGLCNALRFDPRWRPAFTNSADLAIINEGARQAVTVGTAQRADLSYVAVGGKTGTAEYCDNIANERGLCEPGNWPAHAWFVGFAPYDNPEILIVGFVYNGQEGSSVALPMVMCTMDRYLKLLQGQADICALPEAPTFAN